MVCAEALARIEHEMSRFFIVSWVMLLSVLAVSTTTHADGECLYMRGILLPRFNGFPLWARTETEPEVRFFTNRQACYWRMGEVDNSLAKSQDGQYIGLVRDRSETGKHVLARKSDQRKEI